MTTKCANCKNQIKESYICSICHNDYCKSECLISHYDLAHSEKNKEFEKIINDYKEKINTIQKNSKCLSSGTFLNMPPNKFTKKKFDNYTIIKKGSYYCQIGSGSFGDVFLVRDKITNNFYAMKQLNKERIKAMEDSLDLINKEIEIHTKLFHKNIIHLVGTYEDEINIYLFMELAKKRNLFQHIRNQKIENETECFKYFISMVSAVLFLHSHNLIHRDIKPENILLSEDNEVKLCDFGCCAVSSHGARTTLCGTPEYMAPEVMKENSYNSSVDVWSLGILLYELTHGYTPFTKSQNGGKKTEIVLNDILMGNLEFKSKILSEEGKELIKKMVVIDPNKRIKIEDIFMEPFIQKYEKILYPPPPLPPEGKINKNINKNNATCEQNKDGIKINHGKNISEYKQASNLNLNIHKNKEIINKPKIQLIKPKIKLKRPILINRGINFFKINFMNFGIKKNINTHVPLQNNNESLKKKKLLNASCSQGVMHFPSNHIINLKNDNNNNNKLDSHHSINSSTINIEEIKESSKGLPNNSNLLTNLQIKNNYIGNETSQLIDAINILSIANAGNKK